MHPRIYFCAFFRSFFLVIGNQAFLKVENTFSSADYTSGNIGAFISIPIAQQPVKIYEADKRYLWA